jgi:hypothetical protein
VSATCRTPCRRPHEQAVAAQLLAHCSVLRKCWCVRRLDAVPATVPNRRRKREGVVSATCRMRCRRRHERLVVTKLLANCRVLLKCWCVRRLEAYQATVPKKRQKCEGVVSDAVSHITSDSFNESMKGRRAADNLLNSDAPPPRDLCCSAYRARSLVSEVPQSQHPSVLTQRVR